MKCMKCSFENREGAKFCKKCGDKLELRCPSCMHPYDAESLFCDECGQNLRESKEDSPIDYNAPQSYTPRHLADKILTNRSAIEGERKLVTVLFADVAGYTTMSENLDPEEVHQIMDGCFKILMDEIHKYEGTINQFTGDGVMALFGAPVAHEDHARRACLAALSIQKAMSGYGARIETETGQHFKMRIGINSGPVIVGAIGDDLRMDYTAVGDTTNLASRMESLARPGTVMVTGNTRRLVRDYFELESLGPVEVKGKEAPQNVYLLLKPSDVETRLEASMAKGLTRFVGRKNSMTALMESYEKVREGAGQVVGVVGEAGVGKSRLLYEFRNRLDNDITYLEGRCVQFGGTMAFLPFLDILRSYCGIEEGEREFLVKKKLTEKITGLDEKFSCSLPPFQELLSLKVDDEKWLSLEPKEKREKTFEALRDLLIRQSQDKLLVLTIEDLHWIDKSSEEFLGYFIDWLAGARVLLILLYRPEYSHQWGSKTYYNRIGLDQLTMKSSVELIQAVLGQGEILPELRELILGRASGNPLFMEELTYTLLENGSIEKQDNLFVLSRKVSDIQVPDSIQGIIAARMDRLEDNLKRTMQVAAVIGRDFAFRILQSITDLREELKSCLLNLQGLEFIYEKQLFPELEYIFKHALTQEVAYNSLLLKRRKEIHEKIGQVIERIYAERLEEFYEMLAYHYSKSDNLVKTWQYLKLSGQKAAGNYSNWEAYNFFKEAISVLHNMPETEMNKKTQVDLLILLYYSMHNLMFPEGSLQFLEQGEKVSKEIQDTKSHIFFLSRISNYYAWKGEPELGAEYTEKAMIEAQKIQDIDTMADSISGLSVNYFVTGEHYKIIEFAPGILSLLEEKLNDSGLSEYELYQYSLINAHYGLSLGYLGAFKEGASFCRKAVNSVVDLKNPGSSGFIELIFGFFFNIKGDGISAKEQLLKSVENLSEANSAVIGLAWSALGWSHYLLGDLETARVTMMRGIKINADAKIAFASSMQYLVLGMTYFDLGDLENTEQCFEKAIELSVKHKEKGFEGAARVWNGRLLGLKDVSKSDKAEEFITQGMGILDGLRLKTTYTWGRLFLGELYVNKGMREKALGNLKQAEDNYRDMGMDFWLDRTLEVLDRL